MKKICHLTTVHPRYDTRIFLKECKSLEKAGLNVNLIVADGKGDEIKDRINITDIGLAPQNRLLRFITPFFKILKQVKKLKCESVHFHDPELMIVALTIKLFFRKKIIYDIHEDYSKTIMEKTWIKTKILRKTISQLFKAFEKFASLFFDVNIVVLDNWLPKYKNAVSVKNYPIIDTQDYGTYQKKTDLVYVGGLTPERGIYEMLDVFKILQKQLPEISFKLIGYIGDEKLKKIVENIEGENFKYLGYLDLDSAKSIIKESKLGFCLYTLKKFEENIPVKMYEYFSFYTPVICTDFVSWKNIVETNNCGKCVDITNPEKIANTILELLKHPQLIEDMAKNGKSLVTKVHNWKNEEQKLTDTYKKIKLC